jgi:hypothetical protein
MDGIERAQRGGHDTSRQTDDVGSDRSLGNTGERIVDRPAGLVLPEVDADPGTKRPTDLDPGE